MGISGLLPHLGPGERISLAKFSSAHYTTHSRPLRLAIDISIWLFQIQSGCGGSNPALRTFYYRLLRLLSLNIHPLFVFDGPNKPLFKRNKKVGGPGVKVATVPEFLAKQLLKEFGFPWHVAPGEAEAECALLQREKVVDAVLSEDVDTLMFGSGVTLRNWSQEGGGKGHKTPTHVSVYRTEETLERSRGIDREGMVLVALMSGGDYIPEGVPGIGVKVACDAARAGFGRELCALHKKDLVGLREWKSRLEGEIRTNASKFFSRKNTGFVMPGDFPCREVLGYYTHPCVSTPEKVEKLRKEVKWDLDIDFAALRSFTADAFDWRCKGGAKKFIKNLAPALLIRELRLRGGVNEPTDNDVETLETSEQALVHAIHGKRNHVSTDGELEYRISFTPCNLVPIDLALEDEDGEFTPAGGDDSDAESEAFPSTQGGAGDDESGTPVSPSKKRQFKPYYPDQPEKLWILRTFLRAGCPLLVEDYEACTCDPKEFLKQRRNAKAVGKKVANIHAPNQPRKKKAVEREAMPENALTAYARVTKVGISRPDQTACVTASQNVRAMKELSPSANSRSNASSQSSNQQGDIDGHDFAAVAKFKLPSTQIPASLLDNAKASTQKSRDVEVLDLATSSPTAKVPKIPAGIDPLRPFAAFATVRPTSSASHKQSSSQAAIRSDNVQTPKRTSKKRPPPDLSSPALSQKSITSYYSPFGCRQTVDHNVINLVSSSPAPIPDLNEEVDSPLTPTPKARPVSVRGSASPTPKQRPSLEREQVRLPDTVTKRRRKEPLKRSQTAPVGHDSTPADDLIVISSSPARSDAKLASPSLFVSRPKSSNDQAQDRPQRSVSGASIYVDAQETIWQDELADEGGFVRDEDDDAAVLVPEAEPSSTHRSNEPPPRQSSPNLKAAILKPAQPSKPARVPHKAVKQTKTRITLRESLEGAWKEVQVDAAVEAEMLDVTGDGSGWKKSGKRAQIWSGCRMSGVEVLDLTGA